MRNFGCVVFESIRGDIVLESLSGLVRTPRWDETRLSDGYGIVGYNVMLR